MVDNASNQISNLDLRNKFRHFAYLLYYMSGARAVDSVGILPQENHATSIWAPNDRSPYSEQWFFWQLLIQTYLDLHGGRFPMVAIDELEPSDILAIRERVAGRAFRAKYDRLLILAKGEIDILDPDRSLLYVEEIRQIIVELEWRFRDEITKELKARRRQDAIRDTGKGFIALVTAFVPLISAGESLGKAIVHWFRALTGRRDTRRLQARIADRLSTAEEVAHRASGNQTALLEFVEHVRKEAQRTMFE